MWATCDLSRGCPFDRDRRSCLWRTSDFQENRMDYHQNARLTVYSREQLARKLLEQGCTLKAGRRELQREREDRRQVGAPLSRAWGRRAVGPQLQAASLAAANSSSSYRKGFWFCAASAARLPDRPRCGLILATVSRILRRARLNRWRDLIRRPPVVRYEHAAPGDLLHLDIKGMTRFRKSGLRGDGRLRESRGIPASRPCTWPSTTTRGWPSQQIYPTRRPAASLLPARAGVLRPPGIGVRALLTDNGSATAPTVRPRLPRLRLSIAAPDPTRPRPTEKPSASSKLPCANGPMPNTGIAPTSATNTCTLERLLQPRKTSW